MIILCPSFPMSVAMDRPNPREEPVTKTTLASSASMLRLLEDFGTPKLAAVFFWTKAFEVERTRAAARERRDRDENCMFDDVLGVVVVLLRMLESTFERNKNAKLASEIPKFTRSPSSKKQQQDNVHHFLHDEQTHGHGNRHKHHAEKCLPTDKISVGYVIDRIDCEHVKSN